MNYGTYIELIEKQFKSHQMIKKAFKVSIVLCLLVSGIINAQNELIPYRTGDKWGYVDTGKRIILPANFEQTTPFCDNVAWVKFGGVWRLINKSGSPVSTTAYSDVSGFKEGLSYAKYSKYGFVDTKGNMKIPFKYKKVYEYSQGLALVQDDKDMWGFVDMSGKTVINFKYIDARPFSNNLAAVKINDIWGWFFIDKSGRKVIDFTNKYQKVKSFNEGWAPVMNLFGMYGFIDTRNTGKIMFKYIDANPFFQGLASVKQSDKWGFINMQDSIVIDFKYEEAGCFHENLVNVKLNGKWGYVDKADSTWINYKYEATNPFKKGYAKVKRHGKWGYINKKGAEFFKN